MMYIHTYVHIHTVYTAYMYIRMITNKETHTWGVNLIRAHYQLSIKLIHLEIYTNLLIVIEHVISMYKG